MARHGRTMVSESKGAPLSSKDDEQAGSPSTRMQIAHAAGRRAAGGERGWSAITEFSMRMPDGSVRDFASTRAYEPGSLTFVDTINPGRFGREGEPMCPICLDPATAREHVPQAALGGSVMTATCAPCNNGLGSRVEVELEHWFDHTIHRVSFNHDGDIPGHRRVPNVRLLKETDGNEVILLFDGSFPDEAVEMLRSGTAKITYSPPDPRRWGLALLKHAFLAACLYMKCVPETDEIQQIRSELITARDWDMRRRPPESEAASRLRVYRSESGRQGPPLALVVKDPDEAGGEAEILISLAGVLFVTWPFEGIRVGLVADE